MTEMRNETMKVNMLLIVKSGDVIQEFDDAQTEGRGHEERWEPWDDVTGKTLDRGDVFNNKAIAIQYMRGKQIWNKTNRSKAQLTSLKNIKLNVYISTNDIVGAPTIAADLRAKKYSDCNGAEIVSSAATLPLLAQLLVNDAAILMTKIQRYQ